MIYGILLTFGIGGALLNGFNISAKETTAKKEYKLYLRRVGLCLILLVVVIYAMLMLFIYGYYLYGGIMVAVLFLSFFLSAVICNTQRMAYLEKVIKESKEDNTEEKDISSNKS